MLCTSDIFAMHHILRQIVLASPYLQLKGRHYIRLFSPCSFIHMRYQADIELLDQCSAGLFVSSLATCPRTNPLLVLHAFLLLCISNLHLPLEYMINSIYFYASNSERLIYASSHEKRLLPFQTGEFPSGGAYLSQLIIEEASTPRQPK